MDVHEFIVTRPCLEEIDGYLWGYRALYGQPPAEVLGPIETYRARLLAGRDVPAPSLLERQWIYKMRAKPKLKPKWKHEDVEPSFIDEDDQGPPSQQPQETDRKTLDLDARHRRLGEGRLRVLRR